MDKNKQQTIYPGLYIISTPIGNMEDITLRAINVLKKSDIILCEDTRRSAKLLSHFQIKKKLQPYYKFNEKKISGKVIDFLKKGKIVSLVSDAGTPTISDPGMILVSRCINENFKVYPIPGPSAVTAAMSISGFGNQFLFYGFLPKKENDLENTLKNLCSYKYAIIFFISGLKLNYYILKFKKYFLERKILIAREMTKIHENFIREDISSINPLSENLKGEFTIVISEKSKENKNKKVISESVKIEIKKMLKRYSHKDVVELIAKKENLPKKLVYNFCLSLKD